MIRQLVGVHDVGVEHCGLCGARLLVCELVGVFDLGDVDIQ